MDPHGPQRDSQGDVDSLINEYFDRRHAGEDLSPEDFMAEHPESADALRPFIGGLSFLDRIRTAAGEAASQQPADVEDRDLPVVSGYELLEELGRGGMGVVYRALQVSTKRVVALKVMLAGPFASPAARRRFEREVQLAARLQHPHIVRVLESGRVAQQPYYAMDFVPGVPLDHRLKTDTTRAVPAVLSIFQRICHAVAYAHQHGVIHRDLKPANILVDDDGEPHILDFGLAKAVGRADEASTTNVSMPGQVMGTLPYLSPEQATGEVEGVDARTDVYALGVILFEALTGTLPIDTSGRPSQAIQRIIDTPPKSPRAVSDQIDGDLETIILKALEKEQTRRYQSVNDMADDIRRYTEGEPILARRPSSLYVLRKKLRKHRVGVGVVAGLLLLAAVGLWGGIRWKHREFARARDGVLKAQHDVDGGDLDRALGRARVLFNDHHDLPEARLVFAHAQFRSPESHNEALRTLEHGLKQEDLEPWHGAFRSLLADFRRDAGESERADQLRAEAERLTPDTAEAWYVLSYATIDHGRARHHAEQAVNLDARHTLAWRRLAQLCLWLEDWDGASQAADKLIELGQPVADWTLFKIHVLAKEGRYDEAIEQYTKLISLAAGHVTGQKVGEALWCRAHVYRRKNEYAKALEDYRARERMRHGDPGELQWIYYQEAAVLWMLDRPDEAIETCEKFIARYRRPSYTHARLYLILCEQGRRQEADERLQEDRAKVDKLQLKNVFACLAGELAPKDLVESAKSPKERCEACYYAGEAAKLHGTPEQARTWFQECVGTGIEFDPDRVPPTPMNEFDLAEWRLKRMANDE